MKRSERFPGITGERGKELGIHMTGQPQMGSRFAAVVLSTFDVHDVDAHKHKSASVR